MVQSAQQAFGLALPTLTPFAPLPPPPADAPPPARPAMSKARRAMLMASRSNSRIAPDPFLTTAWANVSPSSNKLATQPPPPPPPPPPSNGIMRPRRRRPESLQPSTQTSTTSTPRAHTPTSESGGSEYAVAFAQAAARLRRPTTKRGSAATLFARQQNITNMVMREHGLSESTLPSRSGTPSNMLFDRSETPLYIPSAIENVVRRIQRVWRRHLLVRARHQRKSATRIQAAVRGFLARKHVKEEREALAKGRPVLGLWWMSAHEHRSEVKSAGSSNNNSRAPTPAQHYLDALAAKEEVLSRWAQRAKAAASQTHEAHIHAAETANEPFAERKRAGGAGGCVRATRQQQQRDNAKRRRKRQGLPRWFVYFAYAGALGFCALCSYFIMLYGLVFEPSVARAWLLSALLSLVLEMFLQDPAKIAALALLKDHFKAWLHGVKDRKNAKRRNKYRVHATGALAG
eukprot:jgi/Chlat1/4753/Chrsp308S04739